MYVPNIVSLDQAVIYVERIPDTVQMDHIDWGFRISGLYGENYRYTPHGCHSLRERQDIHCRTRIERSPACTLPSAYRSRQNGCHIKTGC